MYDLPYHKDSNDAVVHRFMQDHPFALLTGSDEGGRPVATQIPLLVEAGEDGVTLLGHMMRSTDHFRAFQANPDVLVIFTGPHVYVSGSWYTNPHTPSTWNYMSVHARGELRVVDDTELTRILIKTSEHFDGGTAESPTTFGNLPTDLTQRLAPMIAGFEIRVQSLEHVFKLSQDRDEDSYQEIIRRLSAGDESARFIAAEMQRRRDRVFPSDSS